jgi:hypothetical protein
VLVVVKCPKGDVFTFSIVKECVVHPCAKLTASYTSSLKPCTLVKESVVHQCASAKFLVNFQTLWVFWLEMIGRVWRDLVDLPFA